MPELDIGQIIHFLEVISSILHLHSHKNIWFLSSQRDLFPHQCFFIHCYLPQPKQEYFFLSSFLPFLCFAHATEMECLKSSICLTIFDHRLYRFCPKRTLVVGNWMLGVPSRSKVRWQGWKVQTSPSCREHDDGSPGKVRVAVTQFLYLNSRACVEVPFPRGSICPLEVWIFSKLVQKLYDYKVCAYLPNSPVALNTDLWVSAVMIAVSDLHQSQYVPLVKEKLFCVWLSQYPE